MRVCRFEVGPFAANCYVLEDMENGGALVVDPGADVEVVAAHLREHGLSVQGYLLTHGHADHISALRAITDRLPAPVYIHEEELRWAFGPYNQVPGAYRVPERPETEMVPVSDEEELAWGATACRVLHTPGHSPGSVCYFFEADGLLFSGDTLFHGSVGRTDLPGGDAGALTASLRALVRLPDATCVYPGHGPKSSIEEEKKVNFFLQPYVRSSHG